MSDEPSRRWTAARLESAFGIAVVIWGSIGAVVLLTGLLKAELALSTVVYLVLGAIYAGIRLIRQFSIWLAVVSIVLIATIGFASEIVGVRTGWPYGHYTYTSYLQPNLWHVPVVMVAAWLFITIESFVVVPVNVSRPLRVVLGALVAVGIDMLIDPVAADVQHLWRWQQTGPYYHIPTQNFFAWFLLECLLQSVLVAFSGKTTTRLKRSVEYPLLSLLLVFTVPALKQGWLAPVVFSLCPWIFIALASKRGVQRV